MDIDNFTDEQVLWAAVLRQAKEDLTYVAKPNENQDYIRERAKVWFENKEPRRFSNEICDIPGCDPQIGSLNWVCGVLNLNPNEVRESVLCE